MPSFPPFLYGTAWKEDDTARCVEDALKAGFRGIDTANQRKHYFEAAVGEAVQKMISEKVVTRKDLFLQTKFTFIHGQDKRLPYDPESSFATQVTQSFESSLDHLSTDYLDSYVLHGPSTGCGLVDADWEVWSQMEELFQTGKVKNLGVSNVDIDQLLALFENATVKPQFVQNRCYASRGWDKDVRDFCRHNEIIYQGFSLLTANLQVFNAPDFNEICGRLGCSPAQAVFAFSRQIGMLPITGTTNLFHMNEDLDSLKITLTQEDLETVEKISS